MRRNTLPLILLLLLTLAACSGGPRAVERYVGTQGLTIEFAENAPPELVYEGTAFPARVLVRNAGAQDIAYDQFLLTFGTDPLYVSGGISPYLPHERDPAPRGVKTLHGKSPGFPTGEQAAFSMPLDNAFEANRVLGQRERPETTITAGICYSYVTHYSESVCVDTNAYQENLRAQPCQAEEIAPTGGQGAPIAITGVKVQGFPVIDRELGIEATRPYFTLTIEDVGGGQLVGPESLELEKACLLQSIPKEQLGAVRIEAFLLNTPLKCQPDGFVRLVDGKGEVRCTVEDNELANPLFASAQNYRSTLLVNLSYIYKKATTATVAIERVPGERTGDVIPLGGRVTGYEYLRAGASAPQATLPDEGKVQLTTTGPVVVDSTGTEWQLLATPDGQAVSSCELYANNPDLIPESQSQLKDVLDSRWSCACGQTRCVTLSRSGQCIAGLCPGTTYCCTDEKLGEGTTTGTTGAAFDVRATVYYLPDCSDFAKWSSTGRELSGSQACSVTSKGFYEAVKCNGSGACEGAPYNYQTIEPTKEASLSGPTQTKCGTTPQAHRTIAVNDDPGTPCYIPYGSRVKLDFGANNPWNGEYVAEDTGSAITGCRIDVYVGEGKAALAAAQSDGLGSSTATVTILEQGTQDC